MAFPAETCTVMVFIPSEVNLNDTLPSKVIKGYSEQDIVTAKTVTTPEYPLIPQRLFLGTSSELSVAPHFL